MARSETMTIPQKNPAFGRNEAPPIVHALGGSIGSALALLLFYPLERARIEMQSKAAAISNDGAMPPMTLVNEEEISPIRCAENSEVLVDSDNDFAIEDATSFDREADTPTSASWSMNSCSIDDDSNTVSTIHDYEDSNAKNDVDNSADGIIRCLLDLRERGVLYKGVKPIISTIFTSQFVFFFLHAYAKGWLMHNAPASAKSSNAGLSLLSSCLAGVGNVLLTNPLWVTNMAIVSGTTETQNLFSELLKIWEDHGPRKLWTGTNASLLLVSNPIIQFVCYEEFKRMRLVSKAKQRPSSGRSIRRTSRIVPTGTLGPTEAFVIAAFAKAIATVCTYPLQLAQTLLRLSNNKSQNIRRNDEDTECSGEMDRKIIAQRQQYKGTIDCLIQLYKKRNAGVTAWFTGMRAKLLQTVLTAAFTFLTYEQILGVVKKVALYTLQMRERQFSGGYRKKLQ